MFTEEQFRQIVAGANIGDVKLAYQRYQQAMIRTHMRWFSKLLRWV